jgi:hypothetical protein
MASKEPLCGQYQCGKAAQIAFLASDCIQYYLARQRMTYLSIFGWSIFLYRLYVAEEPSSVYWRHDYQNAVGDDLARGARLYGQLLAKQRYRTWRIAKYAERLSQEKM